MGSSPQGRAAVCTRPILLAACATQAARLVGVVGIGVADRQVEGTGRGWGLVIDLGRYAIAGLAVVQGCQAQHLGGCAVVERQCGGLGLLASLSAPAELFVHNHRGCGIGSSGLKPAYQAAGAAAKLKTSGDKVEDAKVLDWLLKK